MDTDLQLSWSFTRPSTSSGWKLGSGAQGGMSYFGPTKDSPDGYVVHRFWPQALSKGHIISKGKAIDAEGVGMFVHAIQGMRPNLVASKWNFCNFQSENQGEGEDSKVSGIMMEFTTTSDYGLPPPTTEKKEAEGQPKRQVVTVNIGSISVGGKLAAVTGSTRTGNSQSLEGSNSTEKHLDTVLDPETSYYAPQKLSWNWEGQAIGEDGKGKGNDQLVKAYMNVDLGKAFPKEDCIGLVDKIDVLAEIPYVIKKVVNYVAGTKPYMYQVSFCFFPAVLGLKCWGA